MKPGRRLLLALIVGSAVAPLVTIAAMPLLDPLSNIRPPLTLSYYGFLGSIAAVSLCLTALPLALLTGWLRKGRAQLLAGVNLAVGLLIALFFFVQGRTISPASWILGSVVAAAALIVSTTYLVTRNTSTNA